MMRRRFLIVFFCAYASGLLFFLPASLLATLLPSLSQDGFTLTDVQGSFWNGEGDLNLHGGGQTITCGRIVWNLALPRLLLGQAELAIGQNFEGRRGKAELTAGPRSVQFRHLDLALPAGLLSLSSPSLTVLNPGGTLVLHSKHFSYEKKQGVHQFDGLVHIDWDQATFLHGKNAGSYQVLLRGRAASLEGEWSTRQGLLLVDGKAVWTAGAPFKMNNRVQLAPHEDASAIEPLFRALCPRGGNECRMSLG